ncbi:uncharacterized protein M8220_008846 [Acridotheres tristis]
MTFHQVGKVSEQKSLPAASSFGPGMTAAVLLPSVGEQQKRSNNKPSINHIPDAQVRVAPRWPPSLSEHRVCCAAKTPQKSSAGTAGVGASKPCRLASPGHSGCVEQPWHGGNLLQGYFVFLLADAVCSVCGGLTCVLLLGGLKQRNNADHRFLHSYMSETAANIASSKGLTPAPTCLWSPRAMRRANPCSKTSFLT